MLEIQDDAVTMVIFDPLEKLLKTPQQILTEGESTRCIMELPTSYESSTDFTRPWYVQSLSQFVINQAEQIPAEQTAQCIVGGILLDHLRSERCDDVTKGFICDAVSELLRHSRHASALLAPLVEDVSPDGIENKKSNATRQQLFQALQDILFSPTEETHSRAKGCATLTRAIEALSKTGERGNNTANDDLNFTAIERFLSESIVASNSPFFGVALQLLRAMLHTFPKEMTKFGSQLLISNLASRTSSPPETRCSTCCQSSSTLAPFLCKVHAGTMLQKTEQSTRLTNECLIHLLGVLPLGLWLKQHRMSKSSSGFYRNVVDSLIQVVIVARCLVMRHCTELGSFSVNSLCTAVFTKIPWVDSALTHSGVELWSNLAWLWLKSSLKNQTVVADILISSMGGRVSPDGELPPMTIPASTWLSQESSKGFVLEVLHQIQAHGQKGENIRVFCAMLRTKPEITLASWEEFQALLRSHESASSQIEISLTILESFMLGRKDFPSEQMQGLENSNDISDLAFKVLEKKENDSKAGLRLLAFNIYSSFVKADWRYLGENRPSLTKHFDVMVSHCADTSAKVRPAACKATGEFCTNFISAEMLSNTADDFLYTAAVRVCTTMCFVLLNDKSANARSMALFALGNLALSMNENDAFGLVDANTILEVSGSVRQALEDSNNKVVGNAVRTAGHWGSLLAQSSKDEASTMATQTLVGVVDDLALRVSRIVSLASNEQRADLSWKERSAAKKHGWGACHSLARIFFSLDEIDDKPLKKSIFTAVQQILSCFHHASKISEKVVFAGMAALRSLKPSQLVQVVGKSGLIGDGLASVALLLYGQQEDGGSASSKIFGEASLLFSHLLASATISDVHVALKNELFTKPLLGFVYGWMVEHAMEGRAFEIFAMALQRPGLVSYVDVSLEQNFTSRALLQYKKEQSIALDSDVDDGADEL